MRRYGCSVRNSAVNIVNSVHVKNNIPLGTTVSSHVNLAVGEKTEETYLPVVFVLSIGCLVDICH